MVFPPASGIGVSHFRSAKIIRFCQQGCTNRPFYHIVVTEKRKNQQHPVIEQLGTYDPLPNQYNEKLTSLNLERIKYWIGNGAAVSKPVGQLLGLSGFYPVHPTSFMVAWRNRRSVREKHLQESKEESAISN